MNALRIGSKAGFPPDETPSCQTFVSFDEAMARFCALFNAGRMPLMRQGRDGCAYVCIDPDAAA